MNAMHVVTWVAQGLLAAVFVASAMTKGTMSRARLQATGQTGAAVYPMPFVRFVAFCELLAAFGLVLPQALGIAPVLTPLAAAGLTILMLGAAYTHWKLNEPKSMLANAVLIGLCAVVMVGCWP